MNIKDALVYSTFLILVGIGLLIFNFYVLKPAPGVGDKVLVPETGGFSMIDVVNWNAIVYQKNVAKINVEVGSKLLKPYRIKIKDQGTWNLQVKRNNLVCDIISIELRNARNQRVQIDGELTDYITGTNTLTLEIDITGKDCGGIIGQGYIYWLEIPIQTLDDKIRTETGYIKGFFS